MGFCSASMVTLVNKLGAGLNKVNWTFRATVCLPSQPPECRSFSLDAASDLQEGRGQLKNGGDIIDREPIPQEIISAEIKLVFSTMCVCVCFSLCVAQANCSTWSYVAAQVTTCRWTGLWVSGCSAPGQEQAKIFWSQTRGLKKKNHKSKR